MKNTQKKIQKDKNPSSSKELLAQLEKGPYNDRLVMRILDKLKEENGVAMSTQLEQSLYSDMLAIRTIRKLLKEKKTNK